MVEIRRLIAVRHPVILKIAADLLGIVPVHADEISTVYINQQIEIALEVVIAAGVGIEPVRVSYAGFAPDPLGVPGRRGPVCAQFFPEKETVVVMPGSVSDAPGVIVCKADHVAVIDTFHAFILYVVQHYLDARLDLPMPARHVDVFVPIGRQYRQAVQVVRRLSSYPCW